jgi:hypothetical protein
MPCVNCSQHVFAQEISMEALLACPLQHDISIYKYIYIYICVFVRVLCVPGC